MAADKAKKCAINKAEARPHLGVPREHDVRRRGNTPEPCPAFRHHLGGPFEEQSQLAGRAPKLPEGVTTAPALQPGEVVVADDDVLPKAEALLDKSDLKVSPPHAHHNLAGPVGPQGCLISPRSEVGVLVRHKDVDPMLQVWLAAEGALEHMQRQLPNARSLDCGAAGHAAPQAVAVQAAPAVSPDADNPGGALQDPCPRIRLQLFHKRVLEYLSCALWRAWGAIDLGARGGSLNEVAAGRARCLAAPARADPLRGWPPCPHRAATQPHEPQRPAAARLAGGGPWPLSGRRPRLLGGGLGLEEQALVIWHQSPLGHRRLPDLALALTGLLPG
mmetsp:Transcript_108878/g.307892  ORF Transcript_108878/g.307892 Transcript_108878/m.307892 type:complete len:332 (-) Transcript_108878:560-1555(-)